MSRTERRAFAFLVLAVLLAAIIGYLLSPVRASAASYPPQAERYRRDLIRSARYVFGMSAPVAVLAGQIHQESAWREDARSAYAAGLAQFTPDTVDTMQRAYAKELGGVSRSTAALDPRWALLALCRYDKQLLGMFSARSDADRWAFALAGYNGGAGHILKERALAKSQGLDPERWFDHVEKVRGSRSLANWHQNRDYPYLILVKRQPLYRSWGPGVSVQEVQQ